MPGGSFETKLYSILLIAIPVIFAITVHEAAHGIVAKWRGDNTAYMLGRVTLNPIKHIDPIGTILVPIVLFMTTGFLFGWAKPVPVNWGNLKDPKKDMAWVALAGPFANLIMTLIWAFVIAITVKFQLITNQVFYEHFMQMCSFGIMINLILMLLNLIPIPPLDGSRVVTSFLPMRAAIKYNKLERWGFLILIVLLIIPIGGTTLLGFIINPFFSFSMKIVYQFIHFLL